MFGDSGVRSVGKESKRQKLYVTYHTLFKNQNPEIKLIENRTEQSQFCDFVALVQVK